MAVNGTSLEHKSYSDTLSTLRKAEGIVTLLVYRRDEDGQPDGQPGGLTSTSCQSLFLPEGLSTDQLNR